jgi:hypothetical protein
MRHSSTMRKRRLTVLVFLAAYGAGCTITRTGNPIALAADDGPEICVLEDTAVFHEFRVALQQSLTRRRFIVRTVTSGASQDCPLTLTYTARQSWDFVVYMATADISVYRRGAAVGQATYRAPTAGWSMTTEIYEPTQSKVDAMIARLFPQGAPPALQPRYSIEATGSIGGL